MILQDDNDIIKTARLHYSIYTKKDGKNVKRLILIFIVLTTVLFACSNKPDKEEAEKLPSCLAIIDAAYIPGSNMLVLNTEDPYGETWGKDDGGHAVSIIRTVDLDTGELGVISSPSNEYALLMKLSPNRQKVAFITQTKIVDKGRIRVYEPGTNATTDFMFDENLWPNWFTWTPNSDSLIIETTLYPSRITQVWEIGETRGARLLFETDRGIGFVDFPPDNPAAFTYLRGDSVYVYNTDTNENTLLLQTDFHIGLAEWRSSNTLWLSSSDDTYYLYNLDTKELTPTGNYYPGVINPWNNQILVEFQYHAENTDPEMVVVDASKADIKVTKITDGRHRVFWYNQTSLAYLDARNIIVFNLETGKESDLLQNICR